MTGTSIDGIDVALVEVNGQFPDLQVRFIRGVSADLGELAAQLKAFANGSTLTAAEVTRLAYDLGRTHVSAISEFLYEDSPDLIVLHGQTIFHRPPLSWQMINPWPVAHNFGCDILFDLRGADLAAGGEGAPITPLADFILFRDESKPRIIVNFGGFINYTYLPAGNSYSKGSIKEWIAEVRGGDVSICNQLLDRISRELLKQPFDFGGLTAKSGTTNNQAVADLLARLRPSSTKIKSLGTGDEAFGWLEFYKSKLPPQDILKSACVAIAQTLAETLAPLGKVELYGAGGGMNNRELIEQISRITGQTVQSTEVLRIPPQFREAVEIAILGECSRTGVQITLPRITGAKSSAISYCSIVQEK